MSLDVYLTAPGRRDPVPRERIFIRRDGATAEVGRDEWDEMYPGREPIAMRADETTGNEVYSANITHNLGRMARECGLYEPLWCPEEIAAKRAADLIEPLRAGLGRLNVERERLQEFNPKNGWGNYGLLVRFTQDYLAACEQWPEAEVEVSR